MSKQGYVEISKIFLLILITILSEKSRKTMLHNNSGNLTHWNFPYQGKSVKIKSSPPIEIQWYRRLFHFRLTITTTTILKVFIWTDNQLNAPTKIEGQVTWLTTLLHAQLNSMHQTVRLCISYLLRDKLLSKL